LSALLAQAAPTGDSVDDTVELTSDVIGHVSGFLSPRNLAAFGQANKHFYAISRDPRHIADSIMNTYGSDALNAASRSYITDPAVYAHLLAKYDPLSPTQAYTAMYGVAKIGSYQNIKSLADLIIAKNPDTSLQRVYSGAFVGAAERGNDDLIRLLLSLTTFNQATLHRMMKYSAGAGNHLLARRLFKTYGGTKEGVLLAIQAAAANNHVESFREMYRLNAHNDASDYAAVIAAENGNIAILDEWLATSNRFDMAYKTATRSGRVAVMEHLEAHHPGEYDQIDPCSFLSDAASFGHLAVVLHIMDVCEPSAEEANQAFRYATGSDASAIRESIQPYATLSQHQQSAFIALHAADMNAIDEALDGLLASDEVHDQIKGDVPDMQLQHHLFAYATRLGNIDLINHLASRGLDHVIEDGNIPLITALLSGNSRLLARLFNAGIQGAPPTIDEIADLSIRYDWDQPLCTHTESETECTLMVGAQLGFLPENEGFEMDPATLDRGLTSALSVCQQERLAGAADTLLSNLDAFDKYLVSTNKA
jgi:hypothetical protein